MNTLRIRPKSDYLQTASFENMFVLTEHWQSDLSFYKDEIRFLNTLISKYFIWMTKEESVSVIEDLASELMAFDKRNKDLMNRLETHLSHIGLFVKNAFSQNEQKFRDDHSQLEEDIAQFFKDFRIIKKEVFNIMDHVLESEKIKHLLA